MSVHEIMKAADNASEEELAPKGVLNLNINEELRDLLDILTEDETKELEASVLKEGIRDAIVVWKEENAILDGHNRYRLAQKHGLQFATKELSFQNIDEAKDWMIRNQLGRRNLTRDKFTYYVGQLYNARSAAAAAAGKAATKKVSSEIAKQVGTSERSVRRAGGFATGVDKLGAVLGKIEKNKALSGESELSKAEIEKIGTKPLPVAKKMVEKITQKKAATKAVKDVAKKTRAAAKAADKYEVVVWAPDFDEELPILTAKVPPLADNSLLFLLVPDEYLPTGMDLLKAWKVEYQTSIVLVPNTELWVNPFTKVKHEFLLIGMKGVAAGAATGKEPESVVRGADIKEAAMKAIETHFSHSDSRFSGLGERKGWHT